MPKCIRFQRPLQILVLRRSGMAMSARFIRGVYYDQPYVSEGRPLDSLGVFSYQG